MSYLDKFKLEAIVAGIGFNDGANNGFWRVQPRLKFGKGAGQWIEMGAELRAAFKINGKVKSIPGRSAGSGGTSDTVRLLVQNMSDMGVPDGIYEVNTKHVELIGAVLPKGYLKSKGLDNKGGDNNIGGLTDATDVPELKDMNTAPITPDDIRIINDGINSPEGREQAAFKESDEGKAIAQLPEDAAEPISADEAIKQVTDSDEPQEGDFKPGYQQFGGSKGPDMVYKNGKWTPATPAESKAQGLVKDAGEASSPTQDGDFRPKSDPNDQGFGFVFKKGQWVKASDEDRRKNLNKPKGQDTASSDIVDVRKLTEGMVVKNPDGSTKTVTKVTRTKAQRDSDKAGRKPSGTENFEIEYSDGSKDFEETTNGGLGLGEKPQLREVTGQAAPTADKGDAVGTPISDTDVQKLIDNALNKAGNDEPVSVDDLIMAMKRPDKLEDDNGDDVYDPSKDKNLVKKAPEGTIMNFPQDLVRGTVVRDKDGNEQGVVLDKPEKFTASDGSTGYSFHAVLPDGTIKQLKLRREQELFTDTKRRESRNLPEAPAASDKPAPTPTPIPDEIPEVPETPNTPDAPKEPKTPKTPPVDKTPPAPEYDGPTFIPKERPDNGQDIALPDTNENTLWAKKVAPLRDADGNKVRSINPETGEPKSTFAESPDAVLSALFEEYPDAVIMDNGSILVERTNFSDPDGTVRKFESMIHRTKGSNYMISYRITEPDGTSKEYFSHDYRDSFSSIHGKTNGIMRMSAILKGDLPDDYLPSARRDNNKIWRTYFATGKLADRLKYFRGSEDPNKARVTEDTLIRDLARAEAGGNKNEIGLAEYNLNLLRNDFGGDIKAYRENAAIQTMSLLTIDEITDKYATGRFVKYNKSGGKVLGTTLKSNVDGVYGSIKDKDHEGVIEALDQLSGRLPDLVRNQEVALQVLDRLRVGMRKRFPDQNKQSLSGIITNGFNSWVEKDYSPEVLDAAPHISGAGAVVGKNMLVRYENGDGQYSVGIVHSILPKDKSADPNSPNVYFDYVNVSFRGQDGKIDAPTRVSAKNLTILDDTLDGTEIPKEALDQMTIYTPGLKGEERIRERFGDKFLIPQKSRYTDYFPKATDFISNGYSPRTTKPDQYKVEDLIPGSYLYDADGLPVGQIAAVRETTSESGEKGYTFAHVDPGGAVGFTSVKAGQTRAPKVDISKDDERGSSASDEGFTPNPADFQDAGLDAEGIGSESSDAEQALIDTVADSTFLSNRESLLAIAELAAVTKAKFNYENADSDEDKQTTKEAYKTAATSYYTRLAKYKSMAAKFDGTDYDPASIPSDSILDASDVVAINAKIKATHPPFKASNKGANRAVRTYDELVEEYANPKNTYSGYLPEGWTAPSASAPVEEAQSKSKTTLTLIAEGVLEDKGTISDSVFDMFSKRAALELFVNDSSGEFEVPNYHRLTNATGDRVDVSTNTSVADYVAQERFIDVSASVISDLRDKLDLGDAPLTHVLQNSRDVAGLGSGGAFGYVWSRDMFDVYDNFANFHSIVDRINRFVEDLQTSPREDFVQGRSWFAVDLSQNPELAVRYVASHELGHVMQGKVLRNLGVMPSQREWDRLYGPVADSYRISQYGTSNYNEHFAESFVRWELTGEAEPQFLKFLTDARLLKNK